MRLPRYLAACGVASRRHAERDWITVGRVRVNGQVERNPARTVGPGDVVCVDGVPLRPAPRVTIMLHKPAGVVVSMADPRGRTTVRDLLPPDLGRLYPVGRLDADSEGLLLMTSDGDLAQAVLHPRHGVVRRYMALVVPAPAPAQRARLAAGVRLSDGLARAAWVRSPVRPPRAVTVPSGAPGTWMEVALTEGRNREVRRMCAAVGLEVLRLVRVGLGPVTLGDLPAGRWRPLRADEVRRLRQAGALRGRDPAPERSDPGGTPGSTPLRRARRGSRR